MHAKANLAKSIAMQSVLIDIGPLRIKTVVLSRSLFSYLPNINFMPNDASRIVVEELTKNIKSIPSVYITLSISIK